MYHIFFQPFDALNMMKKHTVRAYVLMLFIGSLLLALSVSLMFHVMSLNPVFATGPVWSQALQFSLVQLFIIATAAIFAMSFVKAFAFHLVMKLFTDKGSFGDMLKIVATTTFLPGVYILFIIILGAIPFVGLALAALVGFLAVILVLTITLRALTAAYKTDLLTVIISFGVVAIAAMIAVHIAFVGMVGTSRFPMMHRYAPGMPAASSTQSPGVQY